MSLLRNWYIVGAIIAAVLALGVFLQFGGALKTWWVTRNLDKAQEAVTNAQNQGEHAQAVNKQVMLEYRQAQMAVASLSKALAKARAEADAFSQKARLKEAEASQFKTTIALLEHSIMQLEVRRKAEQRVSTLREAQDALAKMGIK